MIRTFLTVSGVTLCMAVLLAWLSAWAEDEAQHQLWLEQRTGCCFSPAETRRILRIEKRYGMRFGRNIEKLMQVKEAAGR